MGLYLKSKQQASRYSCEAYGYGNKWSLWQIWANVKVF